MNVAALPAQSQMTNSLIAVAINLVGMLLIYSLMANAITRFYWGRGTLSVLGTIVLAGLFWVMPPFVPNFKNFNSDPVPFWFGNWLVSGFSVVILCQSARWIPRELEDSARMDGFGWFGTYWHVALPLVRRELGLLAVLTAMATSPVLWPPLLPLFSTRLLLMMTAGSVIMTLPVMVIFFLSRRWFPGPAKLE